jgi:hypothetical protein
MRMRRKEDYSLPLESLFYTVVKLLFSNAGKHCVMFKTLNLSDALREDLVLTLDPNS